MSKSKNLAKFSAEQLEKFFVSFDVVFSDIDGVIWNFGSAIKGALESLIALSKLGKTVYLVTNNSTHEIKHLVEKFQRGGLEINPDNIINTSKVIVWYLKKIDFHGDVFMIASEPFRSNLQKAGITMVEQPKIFPMNVPATISELQDRPSVKAVIADFDYHCDWAKMALAISCLKRKEVIYLTGAQDKWVGEKKSRILGPGSMLELISNLSEKEPITCAKPSHIMKDYIWDTYNVSNPRRCLFIGDTVQQDMKFGSMCGFLKLFVGSGCDSLEEALGEEDIYPDYYIPSLGQLFSAFKETQNQQSVNHENHVH